MAHPFEALQKRPDLKDCCRNLLNLDVKRTREDVLKGTCRKCGREHTQMKAYGQGFGKWKMKKHESGLLIPV